MTTDKFKEELKGMSDDTLNIILDMLNIEQQSRYFKRKEKNIHKIMDMLAEIDALCEQENLTIYTDFEYFKGEKINLQDLFIN